MNSDSDEDVPITALEPRERHARRKSDVRGRSKSRLRDLPSDEDIVMSDATVEKPKAKGRGRQTKKSEAVEETKKKEETPEVSTAPKGRGRAAGGGRGRAAKKGDDEAAKEPAATTSAKATESAKETKKTAAKRRKTEKE